MYKIYMYTNKINGKVYIGQTSKSLEERAQKDGQNYQSCPYFFHAIQKYGWGNFEPQILKDNIDTQQDANYWEEYYISQYDSTNSEKGYNIRLGGQTSSFSDATKKKISEKAKERYKDPTKKPNYGKHTSEETKKENKYS